MQKTIGNARIEVVHGDITRQEVDAIVNAANSGLRGGGGVDGAIHRAGGPSIMQECREHRGCPTGDAKITGAGDLPARYVIHAVGPIYEGGANDEAQLLANCHRRSLEIAVEHHCARVAFPAISCGVYSYPVDEAAAIALDTVARFLRDHPKLELVRFVLFTPDILEAFSSALERVE